MKLHKEGNIIILSTFLILGALSAILLCFLAPTHWISLILLFGFALLFVLVVQFFRVPTRHFSAGPNDIISPADGKVVAIEEVEETEYFHGKRIQLSIFMSPLNVHVNWYPIVGKVNYSKYHPGLYLVAWHPKSSTENERTSVVVEHASGQEVLFRQIAGAVARRIVCYAEVDDKAKGGAEFGFIKFGSRIDLLLPLDVELDVKIGDKVKGIETVLGRLKTT